MDDLSPRETPSPADVAVPKYFCRRCDWRGADCYRLDAAARRALIEELKPGDVVPAGCCPTCGGHAYPIRIFEGKLPAIAEDGPGSDWEISFLRAGLGYVLLLTHPEGFGCEIDLEVAHERPRLEVTPFNMPDEMLENAPIGYLSIGEDQVVFTNAPENPIAVVAEERQLRSALMVNDRWLRLRNWNDQP